MREGCPNSILGYWLSRGRREGEAGEWDDAFGGGDRQHAVALVRHGEEALVMFGAWGFSFALDVLAGGDAEGLDGGVVAVQVGWQHLFMVQLCGVIPWERNMYSGQCFDKRISCQPRCDFPQPAKCLKDLFSRKEGVWVEIVTSHVDCFIVIVVGMIGDDHHGLSWNLIRCSEGSRLRFPVYVATIR